MLLGIIIAWLIMGAHAAYLGNKALDKIYPSEPWENAMMYITAIIGPINYLIVFFVVLRKDES